MSETCITIDAAAGNVSEELIAGGDCASLSNDRHSFIHKHRQSNTKRGPSPMHKLSVCLVDITCNIMGTFPGTSFKDTKLSGIYRCTTIWRRQQDSNLVTPRVPSGTVLWADVSSVGHGISQSSAAFAFPD